MNKAGNTAKYYLKRRTQGVREQHDFEFLKKDGTRMYASLETSPLMDEEGRYTGAIASIIDTTEKRHALDALKKSEEKYRAIFENAIEGVFSEYP
jgi:PAS domain S-box-containing protein